MQRLNMREATRFCLAVVTLPIAVKTASILSIFLLYGPHAYFAEGIRLSQLHPHPILSDGVKLPDRVRWLHFAITLALWFAIVWLGTSLGSWIRRQWTKTG